MDTKKKRTALLGTNPLYILRKTKNLHFDLVGTHTNIQLINSEFFQRRPLLCVMLHMCARILTFCAVDNAYVFITTIIVCFALIVILLVC